MYKSEHIITFRHYIVLAVIAFGTGIVLATLVTPEFLSWTCRFLVTFFIILVSVAIILKTITRTKKLSAKPFLLCAFLVFSILAGIFRITAVNYFDPNPLDNFAGKSAWLTGTVNTDPTVTQNGYSVYFQMKVTQINDEDIDTENILIYIPKERGVTLSRGDSICCWTKIKEPVKKSITWPYDYETHLQGQDIFFTGTTKYANPAQSTAPTSVTSYISDVGYETSNAITSAIDGLSLSSSNNANILKGILVGDKSEFSDELYQQFSYAGLSHIVAVSGMHLSILFGFLTLILSKIRIRKRLSVFIIIPVIILFAATANFTPSVCRAAIMIIMMLTATLLRKRYSPINALFLSLGIILLVYPYAIYSRSLTLSFLATLGILVYYKYLIYFMNKFTETIKVKSKGINLFITYILNLITSSLSVSISVTIATAFFSIKIFGAVSWIQFLTNIWVIPSVTAAFCLGYIACIIHYIFPPLADIISYPLDFFLSVIAKTASTFGQNIFIYQPQVEKVPWLAMIICLGIAIFIYLILKTVYDLLEENEKAKPLPGYLYKGPKIPKL